MERESVSSHIDYVTLQQNFHLPISQVAKDLGVCATVLKKLCRQHGIPRWPHRKIKSLNKMIAVLEETKTETEEEEQQRLIELKALLKKKSDIMENPSIIGPTYSHISPRSSTNKPISIINKFHNASPGNQISDIKLTPPMNRMNLIHQQQIHQQIPQQHTLQQQSLNLNLSLQQQTQMQQHQQQQQQQPQQMKMSYSRPAIVYASHSALQSSTSPSRTSPDILQNEFHFAKFANNDRRFSSPLVDVSRPASAPIQPVAMHSAPMHSHFELNNFVKPKFQNYHQINDNFDNYNVLKFTPTRSSAPASILSNHSSAFSQINQSSISQTLIAPVYSSSSAVDELNWSSPAPPPPPNTLQNSDSQSINSMHMNSTLNHSLHQLLATQPIPNLLIDQDNKNASLYHSMPITQQENANLLNSAMEPLSFDMDHPLKCDIGETLTRS